ncbi:MAG: hypothetical protein K2Q22_08565, partial [Cytophagales bacterium]|nr:hypothetical protein [Cytophagales bacterium]
FFPSGPMIEGWQKIEGDFRVPENTATIDLVFNFPADINYYIDDIRIRPTNSLMQTYVYNPDNYRLKASLDDYNYADLYYYDEEGALFLKKKETIKGIKTIQETLSHTKKRPNP